MTPTENPAGGPLDDNDQPGWSEWYSSNPKKSDTYRAGSLLDLALVINFRSLVPTVVCNG